MRLIDADELHAEISKWPDSVMYKDWVQSAIATAPTVPVGGDWVNTKDRLPEEQKRSINIPTGIWQRRNGVAFYNPEHEFERMGAKRRRVHVG